MEAWRGANGVKYLPSASHLKTGRGDSWYKGQEGHAGEGLRNHLTLMCGQENVFSVKKMRPNHCLDKRKLCVTLVMKRGISL